MTAMDHKMREFLKEYDEELYEKYDEELYEETLRREEIQMRVDLAESVLAKDWDSIDVNELFEPYPDDGHDDFGHEFVEVEDDPFYDHAFETSEDKYQGLEEDFDP
jgi:hypothetical protein